MVVRLGRAAAHTVSSALGADQRLIISLQRSTLQAELNQMTSLAYNLHNG